MGLLTVSIVRCDDIQDPNLHHYNCDGRALRAAGKCTKPEGYTWRLWNDPRPKPKTPPWRVGMMTDAKWRVWLRRGAREQLLARVNRHRGDDAARNDPKTLPREEA